MCNYLFYNFSFRFTLTVIHRLVPRTKALARFHSQRPILKISLKNGNVHITIATDEFIKEVTFWYRFTEKDEMRRALELLSLDLRKHTMNIVMASLRKNYRFRDYTPVLFVGNYPYIWKNKSTLQNL